jgi:ClpX C4-type zinc finger
MARCAFCGLGPPRRYHFFSGLAGASICDCCTELAVELGKSPFPLTEVVTGGGPGDVSCRFCGRRRSECGSGGFAGGVPETFICPDCERWAAEDLGVT